MNTFRICTFVETVVIVVTLICSLAVPTYAERLPTDDTTIKVGYFQMEGYHEIDEDGLYSGYDYDFFQLLERYTNLRFEYVGYDKSWQDMQDMLSNGEIDILTSMHVTEARKQKYDFSYDIGSSYTMLTAKLGNNQFQTGDYASYDGMTVGMLMQSSQNDVFDQFATEHGFSYSAVYFDSVTALTEAVHDGTVDTALTSSLRKLHGEHVLEEIEPTQFYAVVNKGNTALLDEINYCITQMDIYDGDWRSTLYCRYYGYQEESSDEVYYSDREQDVISEYSNGGKVLTVCFDPTFEPYSFVSNGEMVGILPDAIAETLDSIGIQYEYVVPSSHEEYLQMYLDGSADVFPETVADVNATLQSMYLFTDSYFTMRVGMLTSRSLRKDIEVVSILDDVNFYNDLELNGVRVVKYETIDEVIKAVLDGRADATYLMNYTAQMYLNSENLSDLAYVSQADMHYDVSFAVNRNVPHELCSILSKNISTFNAKDIYSISLQYIENNASDLTFIEYMQLHPRVALVFFVIIIVVVVVATALIFSNIRRSEKEKQRLDLQKAYQETEIALADAQQYRHAVLSDAFVAYDANLSKNVIEEEVCEEYGDEKFGIFTQLGLSAPCDYDEYIDRICEKMTESDDRELFRQKTKREYLIQLFEEGKTEDVFEYRTKLLNGQIADIRHTTYLTRNNSANDIIAHINDKNITSQRKNERQIRKYEQILITTATDTYKGVRRVNLETQQAEYIRFNDGKITQSDLGNWTEWLDSQSKNVHPDDFNRLRKFLCMESLLSMEVGVPIRQDYRSFETNEHHQNRVYTTTVSITYVGSSKVAIMTTIDNTAAVENEHQQKILLEDALHSAEKANRAKTTFLSNMSHDIRTPMNAIIGFTSLAQAHLGDQQQVEYYLNKISTSSMHLLSLINDVLDMSRIESGRLHIEEKPCNLSKLLQSVHSIVLPDITTNGLRFTIEENVSNADVMCDQLRLNRVLLNILSNAIKFTHAGGSVTLSVVEKTSDTKDTSIYEFNVSDTGIGIGKEFISHVFEPFERERNSTVSGVQGTGLGMSITKNIVDMMGGTISVASVQGEGSTFTVVVPMKKAVSSSDATEEHTDESISVDCISGRRVLLVEDNELNREIALEILSNVGLAVEEAEDGKVAIDMLLNHPSNYYDLVLMDIQMPNMDGYTATQIIRNFHDERLSKIPIIAMTANAFEEDRQKAISMGMNAHIAKPIAIDLLISTLGQVLKRV